MVYECLETSESIQKNCAGLNGDRHGLKETLTGNNDCSEVNNIILQNKVISTI